MFFYFFQFLKSVFSKKPSLSLSEYRMTLEEIKFYLVDLKRNYYCDSSNKIDDNDNDKGFLNTLASRSCRIPDTAAPVSVANIKRNNIMCSGNGCDGDLSVFCHNASNGSISNMSSNIRLSVSYLLSLYIPDVDVDDDLNDDGLLGHGQQRHLVDSLELLRMKKKTNKFIMTASSDSSSSSSSSGGVEICDSSKVIVTTDINKKKDRSSSLAKESVDDDECLAFAGSGKFLFKLVTNCSNDCFLQKAIGCDDDDDDDEVVFREKGKILLLTKK
jgi:hypothetical protein